MGSWAFHPAEFRHRHRARRALHPLSQPLRGEGDLLRREPGLSPCAVLGVSGSAVMLTQPRTTRDRNSETSCGHPELPSRLRPLGDEPWEVLSPPDRSSTGVYCTAWAVSDLFSV